MLTRLRSVRSFDNRVSETIQFYSPLTLIVGFNGSGKTVCFKDPGPTQIAPNSANAADHHRMSQVCYDGRVTTQ